MACTGLGTSATPTVEILADRSPVPRVRVVEAEVYQALDRPDRLEVLLVPEPPGGELPEELPGPGAFISAVAASFDVDRSSRDVLFRGVVLRSTVEICPSRGASLRLVAYARFERLRRRCGTRVYRYATDSEVAGAIASSLELAAVVDPTDGVHERVEVSSDPLIFLRQRATRYGLELAIARNRLYFVERLPWEGEELRVGRSANVLGLEVETRADGPSARGGSLVVVGDPAWRPMRPAILAGVDSRVDGRYRVVRALHCWTPEEYRTRVEILDEDLRVAVWRRATLQSSGKVQRGDDHAT